MQRIAWFGLLYRTLCYNHYTTKMIAFETAMEPTFWFVDKFAKYLGPVSCKPSEPRHEKSVLSSEFLTRSDTNWPVQPQKIDLGRRGVVLSLKR